MSVKYDGGNVFDAAMRGLMAVPGVTPEMIHETARPLIRSLLDLHWDNADGTVGMYDDNPAIVEAFRENGILLFCGAEHPDDGEPCEGIQRGHTVPHRDHLGRTWADGESVE
jgi:hypothetical protein